MAETESFVIILRPAPEYGSPGTDEIVSKHFEHLKRLNQEGKVMMAGRFSDVLIGLVMLEVENRDEAEKIMRSDPAVLANVFHAELYPWSIALEPER
ncbi:MAG: YciI family protein [Candidatus Thorarchaeota archaeon]